MSAINKLGMFLLCCAFLWTIYVILMFAMIILRIYQIVTLISQIYQSIHS